MSYNLVPISVKDLVTVTPTFSKALILSIAFPFPPEIMAPACPILRPGGAEIPAMYAITGLAFAPVLYSERYSAASSSA